MSTSEKIDFIGIGASKSGSTWVSRCLREHPEVSFARKDLQFFSTPNWEHYYFDMPHWGTVFKGSASNYHKGIGWYLNQIPRGGKVRGEFMTSYLVDPKAAVRIQKFFPDVKILVILRNPTNKLYSAYCYYKSGIIVDVPNTFEEFIEAGRVKELGLYHKHLTKFFKRFPAENIHVILFDDVKKDPRKVVRDLYSFLGVDSEFVPPVLHRKVNPTFIPQFEFLKNVAKFSLVSLQKMGLQQASDWILQSKLIHRVYLRINRTNLHYPPMDERTRAKLKEYYLEDIKSLERLIGRDLSHWK